VYEGDGVFAEAIMPVPDTSFVPPCRISLSRYCLGQIRSRSAYRPGLYLYEGIIMPPPPEPARHAD